jgi:hypothetical protein
MFKWDSIRPAKLAVGKSSAVALLRTATLDFQSRFVRKAIGRLYEFPMSVDSLADKMCFRFFPISVRLE